MGKLSGPGPEVCGFDKLNLLGAFSACALGLLENKSDLTIGKDNMISQVTVLPGF